MHNENDSTNKALTLADWTSAIRTNVAAVRSVFGQNAPTMPVDIVYVPYDINPGVEQSAHLSPQVQALKSGFEALAADPTFNATVAAQAGDANMDGPPGTVHPYGEKHFDQIDINTVASRLAVTIADQFWLYARPGSLEAKAKGTLDDVGPEAVSALWDGTNGVVVEFTATPTGGGIVTLSDAAAKGAGWSIVDGNDVIYATSATRIGRKIVLTFASAVPHTTTARLYYGWGTGRIFVESAPPVLNTTTEGPGHDSAIYDVAGRPVWTPGGGVPIN